jgi:anti-sigma factor ChrR (cupin superfamily)
MLIIVSDGILEARDARGQEYGLTRLSRRIRTAKGNADEIVKGILADIDAHCGAQGQGDDMTILAMAIEERRAKRKTTTLPGLPLDATSGRLPTESDAGGEPT